MAPSLVCQSPASRSENTIPTRRAQSSQRRPTIVGNLPSNRRGLAFIYHPEWANHRGLDAHIQESPPLSEPRDLVLLTKAQRALAEASTIDDVRQLRDKAAAVKTYVEKARLGKHLVIEAATLRIRAERRLGEMLQETPLANSAPGNQHTGSSSGSSVDAVLLKDLGITKNESSRSQRIAAVPDAKFEEYLADCVHTEREPTFARLLRLTRDNEQPVAKPEGDKQNSRASEPRAGYEFPDADGPTLLAIPPWPGCVSPDQPALTTDELCDLPVGRLCDADAHLYVWTNRRYLIDGFDLMDAWGFAYYTSLMFAYEEAWSDTPWADAHHLLLVGTRGDLPFRENSAHSWLLCSRPESGQVPDNLHDLIEAASPGPYLQVFGNELSANANWTLYPKSTV